MKYDPGVTDHTEELVKSIKAAVARGELIYDRDSPQGKQFTSLLLVAILRGPDLGFDGLRTVFPHRLLGVSDVELQRVSQLLEGIVGVLATNTGWSRFRAAWLAFNGTSSISERRAAMLHFLRDIASDEITSAEELDWTARNAIELLSDLDERIGNLSLSFTRKVLQRMRPSEDVERGGAGALAPPLAAAKLTCSVQAFDDRDETKAKKAFIAAEKSVRKK